MRTRAAQQETGEAKLLDIQRNVEHGAFYAFTTTSSSMLSWEWELRKAKKKRDYEVLYE